jgi:hypothetical protein
MRNPLRTEAEAFSFVLVVGALFLAVAIAGVVGGARVALAVFLALGLGVAAGLYLRSEPKVREPAIWERRADGRRIVVVANETVAGEALRDEIVHRARDGAEVLVVAPALNSRLRHWTSDEDRARAAAQARLDVSLAALAEAGVEARGQIGDDDPLQALEDALRTFGADEIILSTHPPGRSNWLERGLVTRARELYECPITHVVVDVEHERARAGDAPA